VVDFLELNNRASYSGDLWYYLEARRDGILTVERGPVPLGEETALTLFEVEASGSHRELATHPERIDYADAVGGNVYFVHVSGVRSPVDLRIANLVEVDAQQATATVYGSATRDLIRYNPEPLFLAGMAAQQAVIGEWNSLVLVYVNGVSYLFGAPYHESIRILADENDEVVLGGSNGGDDTLESWSRSEADAAAPSGYRVWRTGTMSGDWGQVYAEAGSITAKGFGGHDTARLWYTRRLENTFVASPTKASMTAGSLSTTAVGFEDVEGILDFGRGGRAELCGSAGEDSLIGNSGGVTLSGAGYTLSARSATDIHVDALAGHDTAEWHGSSPLYDTVTATSSSVFFRSSKAISPDFVTGWFVPSVSVQAENFEVVEAYADGRGGDRATFFDSRGRDVFVGTDTYSEMTYDRGNVVRVHGYPTVVAKSTEGGDDVAYLYDDPAGDDTFYASPTLAKLYGDGFYNQASSFAQVLAYSGVGHGFDVAALYDDPAGDDTFKAWPTSAKLYGAGFFNQAKSFAQVHAYSGVDHGNDIASLYDDPAGNDTFRAWPTEAKLYGNGFYNRAKSFAQVHAYSGVDHGQDVAQLYDDDGGNDTFRAWPIEAKLYGDGFYNRAKSFRTVYGYAEQGSGGTDVGYLYDSTGDDYLQARDGDPSDEDWAMLRDAADAVYAVWAYGLDEIWADSGTGDDDTADEGDNLDFDLHLTGVWEN